MTYFDLKDKLMFKTDLFFTFYLIAPQNGMIDMFRQFSQGDNQDSGKSVYVPDPDLLGQSDPIGILPLNRLTSSFSHDFNGQIIVPTGITINMTT